MDKASLTPSSAARGEIEEFFKRVAASGFQPRLSRAKGTCRFDIAGVGTWDATIKDGVVSVTEGRADASSPDCVVSATPSDFLRILNRVDNMNFMTAVLQEIVTIKGDLVFAYTALGSFVFPESGVPVH